MDTAVGRRGTLHRKCNDALTLLVVVVAIYLLLAPFLPSIKYALFTSKSAPVTYVEPSNFSVTSDEKTAPYPKENRIVIPSARIDEAIIEGNNLGVIETGGAWRKNLWVESPEDEGNTVIVGHRFTYQNPEGAFYNLDKVSVGDEIIVFWEQKKLTYKVSDVKVVPDTEVSVENDRGVRELTIYTCTPLITATERLVLTALPTEGGQEQL